MKLTNAEKYDKAFMRNFKVTKEELPGMKYNYSKNWDSVGHMDLVTDLEEAFGIQVETKDLLALTTYEKGKEIMEAYGVDMNA